MEKVKRPPGRPRKANTGSNILAGIADDNTPAKGYMAGRRSLAASGRFNIKAVAEVLAEKGLDPVQEIVRIYQTEALPADIKIRVMSTLMEYVHAKRKSLEVTGADGGAIQMQNISNDMLAQIAAQALGDVTDVDAKEIG